MTADAALRKALAELVESCSVTGKPEMTRAPQPEVVWRARNALSRQMACYLRCRVCGDVIQTEPA